MVTVGGTTRRVGRRSTGTSNMRQDHRCEQCGTALLNWDAEQKHMAWHKAQSRPAPIRTAQSAAPNAIWNPQPHMATPVHGHRTVRYVAPIWRELWAWDVVQDRCIDFSRVNN